MIYYIQYNIREKVTNRKKACKNKRLKKQRRSCVAVMCGARQGSTNARASPAFVPLFLAASYMLLYMENMAMYIAMTIKPATTARTQRMAGSSLARASAVACSSSES